MAKKAVTYTCVRGSVFKLPYQISKFELRAFLGTVQYPENYYSHVHLDVLEKPPPAPPPDMPPAFIGR